MTEPCKEARRRHTSSWAIVAARGLLAGLGGVGVFVALCVWAAPTEALVILEQDSRQVTFTGEFGTFVMPPPSPFADFRRSAIAARQTSTVSQTQMNAVGEGSTFPSAPTEHGTSTFEIDFSVTVDTQITLSGDLALFDPSLHAFVPGRASVILFDLGASSLIFSSRLPGSYSFLDVLEPGQYRLRAFAAGEANLGDISFGSYSLQASFLPVPEPSTAMLIGVGLCGLSHTLRCSSSRL